LSIIGANGERTVEGELEGQGAADSSLWNDHRFSHPTQSPTRRHQYAALEIAMLPYADL
jgi:hypothetical protein